MLKTMVLVIVVASSLLFVLLTMVLSVTPSKWATALCVVILAILAVVSFCWCCEKFTERNGSW